MSKKLKLSPWHKGSVNPVRAGVYQRDYGASKPFCYWNGKFWGFAGESPDDAFERVFLGESGAQELPWRGVLK